VTRRTLLGSGFAVWCTAGVIVFGQQLAPGLVGAQFDVVSIKRNTSGIGPGTTAPPIFRPDGSLMLKNVPVNTLIARAYPGMDIVTLPDWARTERYDIATTSTLTTATAEDRIAMLRAMLADRFQLKVHIEPREQQVFDLVLARKDGKLGPGLTPSDVNCDSPPAPSTERPDLSAPPPPCTVRMVGAMLRADKQGRLGDLMEGNTSMDRLADALRISAGRVVVNKTGLSGSYRIAMNYDMMGARRPPSVDPSSDAGPSVFTAVQEQLGLKLESSKAQRDALVIDRLERPTPN
jgi:uncharacterized protein (TIGR03435 family)